MFSVAARADLPNDQAMIEADLPALPEGSRTITSYHAHIYWTTPAQRERALHIRRWLEERFVVQLGTIHRPPRRAAASTRSQGQKPPVPLTASQPWTQERRDANSAHGTAAIGCRV